MTSFAWCASCTAHAISQPCSRRSLTEPFRKRPECGRTWRRSSGSGWREGMKVMPRGFAQCRWLLAALLTATPAQAEEEFSAEDLAAIERMFGDYLDGALDLCVADALADAPA